MTYELIALLIILQYLDGVTTYRLLQKGGRELNPLVATVIDWFGVVGGLVAVKGSAVALLVGLSFLSDAPWGWLALACVVYVGVVVNNCMELSK